MAYRKKDESNPTSVMPEADKAAKAMPVLTIDYEKYAQLLDEADVSEDQQREFIEAIWNIVVSFVDLGFGVHPVQEAQKACGKTKKKPRKPALKVPNGVECSQANQFNQISRTANIESDDAVEGVNV